MKGKRITTPTCESMKGKSLHVAGNPPAVIGSVACDRTGDVALGDGLGAELIRFNRHRVKGVSPNRIAITSSAYVKLS